MTERGIIAAMLRLTGSTPGLAPAAEAQALVATTWMECLPDISDDDLLAAAIDYIRNGPSHWPSPGQLLERVPGRREALSDDSDVAYRTTKHWLESHAFRQPEPGELDPSNPDRDTAMLRGLGALGGARGYRLLKSAEDQWHFKTFRTAYQAERALLRSRSELRLLAASRSGLEGGMRPALEGLALLAGQDGGPNAQKVPRKYR